MKYIFQGLSDQGNSPVKMNQDRICILSHPDCCLFVVCDGMGGSDHGERASETLVNHITEWWDNNINRISDILSFNDIIDGIRQCITETSNYIWETTRENEFCGSTIAALLVKNDNYGIIWAGDSRIYEIHKRLFGLDVKQLTVDDVWENKAENIARKTESEIRSDKNYGHLTNAIGIRKSVALNIRTGTVAAGTLFALMSDGIYKYINRNDFNKCMQTALHEDVNNSIRLIKEIVDRNGAPDNYSIILVAESKQ